MSDRSVNPVEAEDIRQAAACREVEWDKFRGKRIAVTGATGLVGKSVVKTLLEANERYGLSCQILAFVRNVEKARAIFSEVAPETLCLIRHDVTQPVDSALTADYLIHGASVTASKQMVQQPVETILTTMDGTRNMMDFAARCHMEGAVYLSSMEAYGVLPPDFGEVRESDLGYVSLSSPRSGYPEGKRMAECLCVAYANEYDVQVSVARLAQTFGAGISPEENRVFAQFARSVLHGEDIVLHTKGDKANCYCYTADAVTALLILLTKGEKGQAYNVANPDTFCSIRQMAELFASQDETGACRLRIEIPADAASLGYAPSSILKLNADKMMSLGWTPKYDMRDMICRLLESMKA